MSYRAGYYDWNSPEIISYFTTQLRNIGWPEATIAAEASSLAQGADAGHYSQGAGMSLQDAAQHWDTRSETERSQVPAPITPVEQEGIDLARGQLANATSAQEAANRLSQEQISVSRQQTAIAQDVWDRYKKIYGPKEEAYVAEAWQGKPTGVEADRSGQEVIQAFDKNVQMARRDLTRMGVNPNSPRYVKLLNDFTMARSAAEAGARTNARRTTEDANWAKKTYAIGLGKGLPSEAAATYGSAGSTMNNAGSTAAQGLSGLAGAYGSLTGMYQGIAGLQSSRQNAQLQAGTQYGLAQQQQNINQRNAPSGLEQFLSFAAPITSAAVGNPKFF